MNDCLEQLAEKRRSIYNLGRRPVMNEDEIAELVRHCVKFSPSAFNSQPCRVVVLFGADSHRLWELTLAELKKSPRPNALPLRKQKSAPLTLASAQFCFSTIRKPPQTCSRNFPYTLTSFPSGQNKPPASCNISYGPRLPNTTSALRSNTTIR